MASQLSFQLAIMPPFVDEHFIISEANHAAFQTLCDWPDAAATTLVPYQLLYGPEGCGKTHLAHIWQKRTQAVFITPLTLASYLPEDILAMHHCFVLEDIDRDIADEKALFHLVNAVKEQKKYLLLTSRIPPLQLKMTLPDLLSRIKAMPSTRIELPDDTLLESILIKHFADRQLRISPGVIQFLLSRIDRSFASIEKVVELLDTKSLAERKNITVPFIRSLWGE